MDKDKLIKNKKRLIALGILGVMLGTTGCSKNNTNEVPSILPISSDFYSFDKYITYAVKGDKAVKLYRGENIYLLFDMKTFDVNEYIFASQFTLFEQKYGGELYDLETEELIVYNSGIATSYNEEYFKYLINNNYVVSLENITNYIEEIEPKEYYTIEEIKELEPLVLKGLKLILEEKSKTLVK